MLWGLCDYPIVQPIKTTAAETIDFDTTDCAKTVDTKPKKLTIQTPVTSDGEHTVVTVFNNRKPD